jgi:hypothetical protein
MFLLWLKVWAAGLERPDSRDSLARAGKPERRGTPVIREPQEQRGRRALQDIQVCRSRLTRSLASIMGLICDDNWLSTYRK